jgi:hypothetical protein
MVGFQNNLLMIINYDFYLINEWFTVNKEWFTGNKEWFTGNKEWFTVNKEWFTGNKEWFTLWLRLMNESLIDFIYGTPCFDFVNLIYVRLDRLYLWEYWMSHQLKNDPILITFLCQF